MEHKRSKETAKKNRRNAATSSRKATMLMELEGNERRVKGKKGKAEKKGKKAEKKGKALEKGKASEEEQTEKYNIRRLLEIDPVKKFCDLCEATDHWAATCPHSWSIRPGAVLGPRALIVCVCCGAADPQLTHKGVPGVDFPARATRRPTSYPSIEEKMRAMKVASDRASSKGAAGGPERQPKLVGAAAAAAACSSDDEDYSTGKPRPWGYDVFI